MVSLFLIQARCHKLIRRDLCLLGIATNWCKWEIINRYLERGWKLATNSWLLSFVINQVAQAKYFALTRHFNDRVFYHLKLATLIATPMMVILIPEKMVWELVFIKDIAICLFGPSHNCVSSNVWVKLQNASHFKLRFHLACKVIQFIHVMTVCAGFVNLVDFDDEQWFLLFHCV